MRAVRIFTQNLRASIPFFPDLLLALCFAFMISGVFFMDSNMHRMFLYVSFLPALYVLFRDKLWKVGFKTYNLIFVLACAFLLFNALSVFWSLNVDSERVFQKIKVAPFLYVSMLGCVFLVRKYPLLWRVFMDLFLMSAIISSFLLLIYSVPIMLDYYSGARSGPNVWRLEGWGKAQNSNQAGLLYGVALLCLIFLKNHMIEVLHKPIFRAFSILCVAAAFVLALSRGAYLAFFCCTILIISLKVFISVENKIPLLRFLIILVALAVLGFFTFPDITTYMVERGTTGRFEIWMSAFHTISQHPFIGSGVGTKYTYPIYDGQKIFMASHEHSLYMSTLRQVGVSGFFLFMSLVLLVWFNSVKYALRTGDYSLLILISFGLFFGLVDFGGYYITLSNEWIVFWIPLAVLVADAKQAEDRCFKTHNIRGK